MFVTCDYRVSLLLLGTAHALANLGKTHMYMSKEHRPQTHYIKLKSQKTKVTSYKHITQNILTQKPNLTLCFVGMV